MVSLDVYSVIKVYAFKISHFLYKHNDFVSMECSSTVLYMECLGCICSFEIFLHNLMSFSVYSAIILS